MSAEDNKRLNLGIRITFLIGVLLLFIVPLVVKQSYFTGTDLGAWIDDWGKFTSCLHLKKFSCGDLSKFPLAYLLNSYILSISNIYDLPAAKSLLFLNILFISLPVIFFLTVRGIGFGLRAAFVYVFAILLTPIPLFYIYSGALEIQSGVVIGIFLSSVILFGNQQSYFKRSSIYIYLIFSSISLALYKDTNILIVIGSLFISILLWRKRLIMSDDKSLEDFLIYDKRFIIFGLLLSTFASFAFNYYKYQSFLPVAYFSEAALTSPSFGKSIEFFWASIFSPNGGGVVFWFASFSITFFLLHLWGMTILKFSLLVVSIFFAGSVVSLALWWAPFGWDSWGNRLILPVMLASIICIISTSKVRGSLAGSRDFLLGVNASDFFPKNIIPKVLIFISIFFSAHFLFVSYYSSKAFLMQKSLFEGSACMRMISELRTDDGVKGMGFWRSNFYYECARERFFHFPRFVN